MRITSHHVAGCTSFAAWLPVTITGLLISFSILVFVGVPTLLIGSTLLIASARAMNGSRPALWTIVIGALPILAWVVVPVLFADNTPDGTLGWMVWWTELLLALFTIAAGTTALGRRRTHPLTR